MHLFRRHHHTTHHQPHNQYSSSSAPYHLDSIGGRGYYDSHHRHHHHHNHNKDLDHVAAGYRAALANPNTTREGREHAKHELHAMGRSAHVPLMTKIKRTLGIRSTPRRRVRYDSPVVNRRTEYAPYH